MPFDMSGNFTREYNWQQDRDNGIKIMAQRMDGEFDNYAGGLNAAFLRTGAVPMEGPILMNDQPIRGIAAGSLLAPGMTFILDPNSGFYQPGVKQIGVVINNARVALFTTSGLQLLSGTAAAPGLSFDNDTDTGFFSPGAGQLAASVNGVQKGLWTDAGLDVNGTLTANGIEIGSGGATLGDNIEIPGHVHAGQEGTFGGNLTVNGMDTFVKNITGDYMLLHNDINVTGTVYAYDTSSEWAHFTNIGDRSGGIWLKNNTTVQASLDILGATHALGSIWSPVVNVTSVPGGVFYISNLGNDPIINFDNGDYMQFDRANNTLYVISASTALMKLTSVRAEFPIDIACSQNVFANNIQVNNADIRGPIYGSWIIEAGHGSGNGRASLIPGDGSHSGYVSFQDSNGNRKGYVGFIPITGSAANMSYQNETGGAHQFAQNVIVDSGFIMANKLLIQDGGNDAYIRCERAGRALYLGADTANVMYLNRTSIGILVSSYFGAQVEVQNAGVNVTGANGCYALQDRGGGQNWIIYANGNTLKYWNSAGGDKHLYLADRYLPYTDRGITLGNTGARWDQVWCSQSTMQTSDAREKDWRGGLNVTELAISKLLVKELGIYRWLHDIEKDGEAAKLQMGIRAQAIIEIFQANGLDALTYGFVSHDFWDAYTYEDADHKVQINPAGDRYSIMFPDLLAFITVGIDQRLTALGG